MSRGVIRFATGLVLGLSAVIGVAATTSASCVPPAMQTFKDDPTSIVVGGQIIAAEPSRVMVDVAQWWGVGPQEQVEIQRPPTDPTVISSTDWNPQVGEGWIIIAKREGDTFSTAVCQQLPDDQATITEVVNSLGDPVAPVASPPTAVEPASTGLAVPVVGGLALLVVLAIGGVAWMLRRPTTRT